MTQASDRLREAREKAGYSSAKAAAEAMGIPVATYIQHENGGRGYPASRADRYAKFFRVQACWLLYGQGEAPSEQARPPSAEQLQQMIEAAVRDVPAGASIGDWPRYVAPVLLDQLEQYQAAGGLKGSSGGGNVPDKPVPPPQPTKRAGKVGSRTP